MQRYFFISYPSGLDRPWVVRLIADVERELRIQTGEVLQMSIDRQPSETEDALAVAATAPCMVAMLSDQYFADVTCGRQWSIFTARMSLDEARRRELARHCLVPVLWRPVRSTPDSVDLSPESVVDVPVAEASAAGAPVPSGRPPLTGAGIFDLMRTRRDDAYERIVRTVATRVAAAQERRLAPWPDAVDGLPPEFGEAGDPPGTALPDLPERVAISYDRADEPWADWLRDLLRQVGYQVVLAEQRRGPHESPSRLIAEARGMADRVVAILSRNSLRGPTPGPDWIVALGDNPENRGRLVCMHVDHDPPAVGKSLLPTVSMYGLRDKAVGELLRAIGSP